MRYFYNDKMRQGIVFFEVWRRGGVDVARVLSFARKGVNRLLGGWVCFLALWIGAGFHAFGQESQSLDSTWRVQVGGRSAWVNPDGTFTILNIGVPPQFAPDSSQANGTALPYYARLIGFKAEGGQLRYVYSDALEIIPGQTIRIAANQLTFSDTLPVVVTSLSLAADPARLGVGATARLRVIASMADGSRRDVTALANRTVYRSSNPVVASVSAEGIVTGHSAGFAHIAAVYEGMTASGEIAVGNSEVARTIIGFVYNPDGQPVADAWVHVPGTTRTTATDASGRYQIADVPASLIRPAVRVVSSASDSLFGRVSSLDTSLAVVDGGILTARTIAQIYALPCADADQDCLPEDVETALGLNPNSGDSDGNGVDDGMEDADGDSLPNRLELWLGLLPQSADSDGDGIGDGMEALQYRSMPDLADSDGNGVVDGVQDQDGDGILDVAEDGNGNFNVDEGETNPRLADSDGDGVLDAQEIVDGTSPANEYALEPRALSRFAFDTAEFLGGSGQEPLINEGGVPVSSFNSRGDKAYSADNGNRLVYRVVESDNRINLNLLRGTVRFWFKPNNWSSGEDGHSFGSRLLEVGRYSSEGRGNGWWGLFLNQDRTKLSFGSQGANSNTSRWETYIESEPLDFHIGQWYEVELCYGPRITYPYGRKNPLQEQEYSNAYLYIDGRRVGYGPGVDPNQLPNQAAIAGGFALGSQRDGGLSAEVAMDELYTYNYPLHTWSQKTLSDRNWFARVNRTNNTIVLERNFPVAPKFPLQVTIFRRPFGSTNWGVPRVYNYRGVQFEDRAVESGLAYEYRIWDTNALNSSATRPIVLQQHLTAAMDLPPTHERGKAILMIENSVAPLLSAEIAAWKLNLVGDGWEVVSHLAPRQNDDDFQQNSQSIAEIKSLIDSESATNRTNVVLLLGHVPVPLSGTIAADGHADHRGAWSADGFYGTTNQHFWTDSLRASTAGGSNSRLFNEPGDGKWDQNYLPQPFGSAVGRIDFARMPAFTNASFLPGYPNLTVRSAEVELLRQYLNKNHRYRHGELKFQGRFSGFRGFGQTRDVDNGFYNAQNLSASLYGLAEDRFIRMRPLSQRVSYMFGFHEMNGFSTGILLGWAFRNSSINYRHSAEDLAILENEPSIGFYLVYGSYFGDWNLSPNNWMKALLATPNSGLAAFYHYPNKWRLEKLGLGAPLAVGMQEFNDPTKYENHEVLPNGDVASSYSPDLAPPRMLSILGDPTLRVHVLPPPFNPQATVRENQVFLSWSPSPANGAHYYVHRSINGIDGPFVPLAEAEPISSPNWVDSSAPSGPKVYRIRAGKLRQSGSGSYVNLSQGIFLAVE